MKEDEVREQTIQGLANMLRTTPFKVEFKVKKNPQGIKVIIDVTQDQMEEMMSNMANRSKGN